MHNANSVRITDYFKINDGNTQRDYNQNDFNKLLNGSRSSIKHAKKFEEKVDAYFTSAFSCMGKGRYQEALPHITSALTITDKAKVLHAKLPLLHTMRADIYRIFNAYAGALQEAREGFLCLLKTGYLNTLAESDSRAVHAYCCSVLAELLFIHGRFDEAAVNAKIALSIYQEDPNAHWILAAIEQQHNDTIASDQTPPYHQSQVVQKTPNQSLHTPHMEQHANLAMQTPYPHQATLLHSQSDVLLAQAIPAIVAEPQIAPLSTIPTTNTTITQQTSDNRPKQNCSNQNNPPKLTPIRTLFPDQFPQKAQTRLNGTSTITPTFSMHRKNEHNHPTASQRTTPPLPSTHPQTQRPTPTITRTAQSHISTTTAVAPRPRPMTQPTAATTMPVTTQTLENSRRQLRQPSPPTARFPSLTLPPLSIDPNDSEVTSHIGFQLPHKIPCLNRRTNYNPAAYSATTTATAPYATSTSVITRNPHEFFTQPSTVTTPSHTSTPQQNPYNLINKRKAPSDPHNNQEPKSKRPRFQ